MGRLYIVLLALGIVGCVYLVGVGNRLGSSESDETQVADESAGDLITRTPLGNLAVRSASAPVRRGVAASYMRALGPEFSSEAFFFTALDAPADMLATMAWQEGFNPNSRWAYTAYQWGQNSSSNSQGGRAYQGQNSQGGGGYQPVFTGFSGSGFGSGDSGGGSGGQNSGNGLSYADQLGRYLPSTAVPADLPATSDSTPLPGISQGSGGSGNDSPGGPNITNIPSSDVTPPLPPIINPDPPTDPVIPGNDAPVATPEPATMILAGLGLFGLGAARRRKAALS
jgi:hypothetical protein